MESMQIQLTPENEKRLEEYARRMKAQIRDYQTSPTSIVNVFFGEAIVRKIHQMGKQPAVK